MTPCARAIRIGRGRRNAIAAKKTTDSPAVPLVVGVAGHRDLHPHCLDALKRDVTAEFRKLLEDYPHTPILVLSPLGEGADRLVAEVVAGLGERVQLVAVLPWPRGVADDEWHRSGNREDFDALLPTASHTICVPLEEGVDGSRLGNSADLRQRQFAAVGKYIALHSELLFALWDGVECEESQTCQLIRALRDAEGSPFLSHLGYLDEPETGPVRHFLATRSGRETASAGETKSENWLYPAKFARRFPGIARNLEQFNRDAARLRERLAGEIADSKGYVFPAEEQEALPSTVRFLLERFAIADALALYFQRYTNWLMLGLLAVIFLTIASFESYAHLAPDTGWLMFGYFLFFGGGTAAAFLARRNRLYRRYLDYRALAEALRVHLFWKLAGLREEAADFYLRSFRSDLDWLRVALRSWSVQSGDHDCRRGKPEAPSPADEATRLRLVRDNWIADQRKFFAKKAPWNRKKSRQWEITANVFLFASLSLAVFQGYRLIAASVQGEQLGHDHLTHALIVMIALCGVLAGLAHEYSERRAFEKQARSYESMAALYERAGKSFDRLLASGGRAHLRELAIELGRDALAENADWVIYHRERPPVMKGH